MSKGNNTAWRQMTFTDELQEIVKETASMPPDLLSANESMMRAMALRLLGLKHGATWDERPVHGYDGR